MLSSLEVKVLPPNLMEVRVRLKVVFNRDLVHKLLQDGLSIREICQRMDLSIGTVSRTLAEAA